MPIDKRFIKRFIVNPVDMGNDVTEYIIILSDYGYWADRIDELVEWCDQREAAVTMGMTVTLGDESSLSEFLLKWS